MAKYSTGSGGGGDDGGSCELCGTESSKLQRANVAGANLLVCSGCAPHGDNQHKDRKRSEQQTTRDQSEQSRKKRAVKSAAKMHDAQKGDSKHWEEHGTNYEKDRLPYLVSGYGEIAEQARQDEGLQLAELSDELEVDEDHLLAVEQGRAARANVGGSVVEKLEKRLDIELIDE